MAGDRRHRDATHYIHGVDEQGRPAPVCIVPARVAAYLERWAGLDSFRREHRGQDQEVDQILVALHQVAMSWRGSALGTRDATQPEPAASSQWLTSTQAANIAGVTDRAIRKAIQHGALRASNVDGRWRISREDLAHYRAGRAA